MSGDGADRGAAPWPAGAIIDTWPPIGDEPGDEPRKRQTVFGKKCLSHGISPSANTAAILMLGLSPYTSSTVAPLQTLLRDKDVPDEASVTATQMAHPAGHPNVCGDISLSVKNLLVELAHLWCNDSRPSDTARMGFKGIEKFTTSS